MSQTLLRPDGSKLIYERFAPDISAKAGVVFMHGFQSDRNATKAMFMDGVCRKAGIPYIRFDFYAHGADESAWEDFTIGRAVHDTLLVMDNLTAGPLILMGSSMGGWVGLRCAEERLERVSGLVFVAPAPDFTLKVAQNDLSDPQISQKYTLTS